jgi:4a-hydroxytetrahydrobiopterin dehydratase
MTQLNEEVCEACRLGVPQLTPKEITDLHTQIPAWQLIDDEGVKKLRREFSFSNFAEAMAFAVRVGELAEVHNHHPLMTLEWGRVTVLWWTHKIQGLHRNDAIMAAKTDVLFS